MTHTLALAAATALIALSSASVAWADATPPPPPQHEWIGKGQFGFLDSKGNANSASVNGNIDMSRYDDAWKNELYLSGLYGSNTGVVSAERLEAREQSNYTISTGTFAFGGLRYEHDLFDGFQYQESITGGAGYKFLDADGDKLTAQAGPGYRRLRPEVIVRGNNGAVTSRTPLAASGEAIATASVDYSHTFTPTTTLTNKFLMEYGSADTSTHDEIALVVKMSTKLALSVGYAITDNSKPPAPLKKVDTLTTVNVVFSF